MPWTRSDGALAAADIVVTATGATEPVLTSAAVEEAMRTRRHRPLFVIDIALPRDVEPSVGRSRPGVPLPHGRSAGDRQREPRAGAAPSWRAPRRSSTRKWRASARGCSRARSCRPSSRCASASNSIRQSELQRLEPKIAPALPRGPGARGRDHPSDRREAAADADRAAEGRERRSARGRLTPRRCTGSSRSRRRRPEAKSLTTARTLRSRSADGVDSPARTTLRIGTRGSRLALWQANTVAALLRSARRRSRDGRRSRRPAIGRRSAGAGRRQQASVREGDRRRAARADESTSAVHSAKDMSAVAARKGSRSPPCCRARIRATRSCCRSDAASGPSAVCGTASHRHRQRAPHARSCGASCPAATFVPIRGNVDTRLRKLDAGEFDALVLACAGSAAPRLRCPDFGSDSTRPVRSGPRSGYRGDRDQGRR